MPGIQQHTITSAQDKMTLSKESQDEEVTIIAQMRTKHKSIWVQPDGHVATIDPNKQYWITVQLTLPPKWQQRALQLVLECTRAITNIALPASARMVVRDQNEDSDSELALDASALPAADEQRVVDWANTWMTHFVAEKQASGRYKAYIQGFHRTGAVISPFRDDVATAKAAVYETVLEMGRRLVTAGWDLPC